MNQEFLKCDALGCDYRVELEEITEDHVDTPCPNCGANLLTAEDWGMWKLLRNITRMAGKFTDGGPVSKEQELDVSLHQGQVVIEVRG